MSWSVSRAKYRAYLHRARRRAMRCELREREAIVLFNRACVYCGAPAHTAALNGIDRVDSRAGYALANCVPACRQCNVMKWDYPVEAFYAQVARIHRQRRLFAQRAAAARTSAQAGYIGRHRPAAESEK